MKRFVPVALLAACVAIPAQAQTMSPQAYVAAAGASDLYEKTSSQLVLQSTRDAKIRSFAQMMVRDHAKSTAMVKAAAASARVTALAPKLNAEQAGMVAELRSASGPARDRAYVMQQQAAHNKALALQQDYAASGTAASLKAAAGKIVPVVQHHIDMLKSM